MKRVLIVEVGGSHDEVLLSLYRDVKKLGAEVFVACPKYMWTRLTITDASGWLEAEACGGILRRYQMIRDIRRYARQNDIQYIFLNTASGTTLRDLSRMLPSRCKIIGTLHDTSKIIYSHNQKVVTRNVSAYTVLAPYVLDVIPRDFTKPVFVLTATALDNVTGLESYPGARSADQSVAEGREFRFSANAHATPLRVVVPGSANRHRRDYDALSGPEIAARLGGNVRIVMTGDTNADPSGFIPHTTYDSMISEADIILPLIHPSCRDYGHYVKSRISGAMSSAWAYAKPLMLERGFEQHASLAQSIFYDVDALPEVLRTFAEDRSLLEPYAVTPPFARNEVRLGTLEKLLS